MFGVPAGCAVPIMAQAQLVAFRSLFLVSSATP